MLRQFAFGIAVMLLAGWADPTRGWLIALVVLTGLAAIRPRPWGVFRPALDARLASFVFAVLLLAGAIEPTRDWLIALTAVTGVAAFMPRLFSLDGGGGRGERWRRRWNWDGDTWR
jgi:hypothetical protein